jgi:hypothetical protein
MQFKDDDSECVFAPWSGWVELAPADKPILDAQTLARAWAEAMEAKMGGRGAFLRSSRNLRAIADEGFGEVAAPATQPLRTADERLRRDALDLLYRHWKYGDKLRRAFAG